MGVDGYALVGAKVLMPGGDLADRFVRVAGGKIGSVSGGSPGSDERSIDVGGCLLAPGFVDIHLNGGGGASV